MDPSTRTELISLTKSLLDAVATSDWARYEALCDATLTCFEPEARGQLVEGLEFHKHYFQRSASGEITQTLCSPVVRELGPNAALVAYVRLVQRSDPSGAMVTDRWEESRVWQRGADGWKLVHFHRSPGS